MTDHLGDYRAAQAAGHHADCDGYRTAHRVTVARLDCGTFAASCEDGCELHAGSLGSRADAERFHAGHSREVACDGRCREWSAAA